jgi:hypothetical protein
VAHASATTLLADGAFRDTVRIEVRLPAGVERSSLRDWSCQLLIPVARDPAGAAVFVPGATAEARVAGYTTITGQRVASAAMYVSGSFSR